MYIGSCGGVYFGHGRHARCCVVRKAGPNRGRSFWGCAEEREEQCGFFMWSDDNVASAVVGGCRRVLLAGREEQLVAKQAKIYGATSNRHLVRDFYRMVTEL